MDEPVITAEAPPVKLRSLAQQETDFTSEGSPPPGVVGPVQSLPPVEMASDHVQRPGTLDPKDQSPAHAHGRAHSRKPDHSADPARTPGKPPAAHG